jgi:hypothetical protein
VPIKKAGRGHNSYLVFRLVWSYFLHLILLTPRIYDLGVGESHCLIREHTVEVNQLPDKCLIAVLRKMYIAMVELGQSDY